MFALRDAGAGLAEPAAENSSEEPSYAEWVNKLREPAQQMYPKIEPYEHGTLAVGDGHRIYYEVSGNPTGKPVVFLHGGPGGATSPAHRRLFNPEKYRIVLFDQRGCGKSTPHASAPDADLSSNTTWHLVADMELLRTKLGVEKWQVFGGSWGSTLALAYAQEHSDRVTELILRGIFTLRKSELDWFYQEGASNIFPDRWAPYLAQVPEVERGDIMSAYHRMLTNPDPAVHIPAGVAWTTWESATVFLLEDDEYIAESADPAFATAFARIENHFFMNRGWLEEGQLIAQADRLADIPGVIVQGRYDVVCPARTAWDLHQAWPKSELIIAADAGHAFDEPGILEELIKATDRFAN